MPAVYADEHARLEAIRAFLQGLALSGLDDALARFQMPSGLVDAHAFVRLLFDHEEAAFALQHRRNRYTDRRHVVVRGSDAVNGILTNEKGREHRPCLGRAPPRRERTLICGINFSAFDPCPALFLSLPSWPARHSSKAERSWLRTGSTGTDHGWAPHRPRQSWERAGRRRSGC